MNIKALIVDDERLARNRLRRLLTELDVTVVAEGVDGIEAVKLAQSHAADIMFLDINMPRMNGLEAAKKINEQIDQPPSVIFCTAYDEFALQAFETNASAYLLKPANSEELAKVIKRAGQISRLQANRNAENANYSGTNVNSISRSAALVISQQNVTESIPLRDILFFHSIDKHVFAFIKQRGEVLVDYTLKNLQSEFADQLVRTHRSSLVNKDYLVKLKKDDEGFACLVMRDTEQTIPVSRRYYAAVKKCFVT